MFLPYGTTCYNENPPWGTRLLLVANIAVFAGVRSGVIEASAWQLEWSDPLRFGLVGSAFLHLEWLHLASNLLYLWILGRVVEGTIGTRAFLIFCLATVLLGHGLGAVVFQGREGGAYGASGLAFGLLTSAFLIAPRSKVHCIFWFLGRPSPFDMSLGAFTAFIIGLELLGFAMTGLRPSSELMHLFGAVAGAALAYLCLKLRWLETGGWDWLSLMRRKNTG